jgi:hypothetical protein
VRQYFQAQSAFCRTARRKRLRSKRRTECFLVPCPAMPFSVGMVQWAVGLPFGTPSLILWYTQHVPSTRVTFASVYCFLCSLRWKGQLRSCYWSCPSCQSQAHLLLEFDAPSQTTIFVQRTKTHLSRPTHPSLTHFKVQPQPTALARVGQSNQSHHHRRPHRSYNWIAPTSV